MTATSTPIGEKNDADNYLSNRENELRICYNKGCEKRFDPAQNKEDSCVYHPGSPIFHDAYKIWKCCNKKSTDFTTWLSFPGCTRGPHNGDKPVGDAPKIVATKEIRPEKEEEVVVWNGLNKPAERPTTRRDMLTLAVILTEDAKKAIEEEMRKRNEPREGAESADSVEKLIGASCKNNTCKEVYTGPQTDGKECVHHPGEAVFHEGMKFWSCCKRKTTEFGAFLEQEGCARGKHCWVKNERVENVREDWFQRNGQLSISIYCKAAVLEGTRVESDGISLKATIKHGFGDKETVREYELFGEILPAESMVLVSERKVELVLRQAGKESWPRLCYGEEAK